MIDGQKFFDQLVKNDVRTLQLLKEMITQLTVCWNLTILKNIIKRSTTLLLQQALDADPKAI